LIDSRTKRRLFWGFLTGWVSRLSSTLIQLVQLPVFLHYWSVPLYGDWLIVTAIPTYLSFANIGFGTVAGNEMTMLVAGGDRDGALRVFQSCWWLISAICCGSIALLSAGLYFFPAARLLRLNEISEADTKWIIFFLGVSVLLAQLEGLLQSAYRCIERYSYASLVKSLMALIAFAATMVAVALHQGARVTAIVFAAVNVAGTIFFAVLVRRDIPWIEFGWRHASVIQIRGLMRPAIAFMGFPIGQALNISGTQLAVNYALGPTSVVVFSAARTVSRVALQMVQMVSGTFEPELTIAFGARKIELTRTLHRRACQLALIVALVLVAGVITVGPWILIHWSRGHVPPSRGLLSILLTVVVAFSLWSTSATLMTATNQHQKMAAVFLAGTSLTCVLCYFFARWYGLWGAAASLLISELAMNLYVLPASLRIARDTFPAFLESMLHYPSSLKPGALLTRMRRRRVQESESEETLPL
jgi:O-antigen/teichoic acid export membrane protein